MSVRGHIWLLKPSAVGWLLWRKLECGPQCNTGLGVFRNRAAGHTSSPPLPLNSSRSPRPPALPKLTWFFCVSRDLNPGGFIAPEVLSLVEGGTPGTPSPLYAPMDLPTCMDTPDIPRHVFEFVMDDVTPPAPAKAPGGGGDMFSRGSYKG